MGLFGNNDKKLTIELAKEMAHSHNDTNKEILELMAGFDSKLDVFQHLSEELIDIVENILPKLDTKEANTITSLSERVVELQEEYLNSYSKTCQLSKNHNGRTEHAIDKYQAISE